MAAHQTVHRQINETHKTAPAEGRETMLRESILPER